MNEEAKPRSKNIYIGAPQCFELEMAIFTVCDAFDCYKPPHYSGCYVVGSVLQKPDWRDVDIRMILSDMQFKEIFPAAGDHWESDIRWLLLTTCISQWLSIRTGLPIDFQFQAQTLANKQHQGIRSAIGLHISPDNRFVEK